MKMTALEQQPVREERMGDKGGDIVAEETIMKEHQEAQAEYVPQSPQYIPANEDEEEDMSSDEDIEAPYLLPKSANATPPNEDLRTGYYAMSQEDQPTQPPASESSGEESVPDLVDLQEEHQPPPVPPKRAVHPATLRLDKRQSLLQPTPLLSPTSKGKPGKSAITVPLVSVEQVPEEEIIHIDDDREPSPLQCMRQQVDRLLMPLPMATAPCIQ